MNKSIHLNADELDLAVIERIRRLFGHQRIVIAADNSTGTRNKPGVLARDLPRLLAGVGTLSEEDLAAFSADVEAARREANDSQLPDPWASS